MIRCALRQRAGRDGAHEPLGFHVRHEPHHQAAEHGADRHGHAPPGGVLQRHHGKHDHADAPQDCPGHGLQQGNAQHQVPHHVRVVGLGVALPAQHRCEEIQCHRNARDHGEGEVCHVEGRSGGVEAGQFLGFREGDEEAEERCDRQRAHDVGGEDRRCVQGPGGSPGPREVAQQLFHALQTIERWWFSCRIGYPIRCRIRCPICCLDCGCE